MITHDVVIVGAGLAGMRAAIESAKVADTAVFTKVHPVRSHSGGAQGGINAAINPKDSWKDHWFDTVKGGDFLGDQDKAQVFTEEAPERIYELERWGVVFSRTSDGSIAQRPFGGMNFHRCCYASDKTGFLLLQTLYEQVLRHRVRVYEEWVVTKLIVEEGSVRGVVAYELTTGKIHAIRAKAVVLATGGTGRMYRVTSNAHACTGDGRAMAYRAGSPLEDVEFVQFHPTGLYGHGILVTEGCRGEGGFLLNGEGERFMMTYAPTKIELGPRDLVSRSIWTEIREGRGVRGEQAVYLDLRHLGKERIMDRLPQVHSLCRDYLGIDCIKDPIPIQPTAHYFMGGVPVDVWGASTYLQGLFAAGEVSCISIHGANRLGGNSLLDTQVFGRRAGIAAARFVQGRELLGFPNGQYDQEVARIQTVMERTTGTNIGELRTELQRTLTDLVGVFRNGPDLQRAVLAIEALQRKAQDMVVMDKSMIFNTDLVGALELQNLLLGAELIAKGALRRTESRGAHFRTDFLKRDDDNWLRHSLVFAGSDGPLWKDGEVTLTEFKPSERKY